MSCPAGTRGTGPYNGLYYRCELEEGHLGPHSGVAYDRGMPYRLSWTEQSSTPSPAPRREPRWPSRRRPG
jgi:hypothetical protein